MFISEDLPRLVIADRLSDVVTSRGGIPLFAYDGSMAKTVLIVEDDPVSRQVVSTAVRKAGYETIMAADSVLALTLLTRHKPHAIILDLGLPGGGGLLFLKRVQRLPAFGSIPVIVVSGQDRQTSEPAAIAAGVAHYFEKPVEPELVIAALREVLGEG